MLCLSSFHLIPYRILRGYWILDTFAMKKISPECEKTHPSCVINIEEDTDMNDKSILEGLFRQHYGKMIHLARTLLHDDAEAQDVVQDVFARLLENEYQMTGSKTEAYLMSAVRNDCLNHIRKMQLRERFKHFHPLDEADDTRPSEEVLAELDQINTIVEEQIEEPQRTIFRLRFDEELTFQEIATRLDLSVGAVYKYLRQCINRIKSLI